MAKRETTGEAPRAQAQVNNQRQVVYLGPTLVEDGNVFSHGSIFNNGLPAHYSTKIALEPDFAHLIVPVEKAAKALVELQDALSFRYQLGRKFLEASRKRSSSQEAAK